MSALNEVTISSENPKVNLIFSITKDQDSTDSIEHVELVSVSKNGTLVKGTVKIIREDQVIVEYKHQPSGVHLQVNKQTGQAVVEGSGQYKVVVALHLENKNRRLMH